MRKIKGLCAALCFILLLSGCGGVLAEQCNFHDFYLAAPRLYVELAGDEGQRISAIRGLTNWRHECPDGRTVYFMADSPHSLQISQADLAQATLYLHEGVNEIGLFFSLPPQTVSVVRWNEAAEPQAGVPGSAVALTGRAIIVEYSGYSYIYEVRATWEQGFSHFTFRTGTRCGN